MLKLITDLMFILSSIFSGLWFWSVNHNSIYENSESNVFKDIKFVDEIFSNWSDDLLVTNVGILNLVGNHC